MTAFSFPSLPLAVRRRRCRISSMTVVAATICRRRNAIVLAADRATVTGNPLEEMLPLQFDSPISKIRILGDNIAVAVAGAVAQGQCIVDAVSGNTLASVAAALENGRAALRGQFIAEREQFDAVARAWIAVSQKAGMQDAAKQFIVKSMGWAVDFLVAAVDAHGPHVCTITEASPRPLYFDTHGFAAIGGGAGKAVASMSRWSVKIADDLPTAVYAAFEAKREAELTPGVGTATDLVILQQGMEPIRWEVDGLEPLDGAYHAMHPRNLQADLRSGIATLLGSKGITT